MGKQKIDMKQDPRKSHFDYFSTLAYPYVGATCEVDITGLMEKLKVSGDPFFLSFTYQVIAAANTVPEFRRRIEEGEVVEYDVCRGSCIVAKDDGTYAYCTLSNAPSAEAFILEGKTAMEQAKRGGDIVEDEDVGELFFLSCVPWMHYKDLTQPVPYPADSNVRITWGKYVSEGNRIHLPVTILAHHALVDGLHLGRFYQELERRVAIESNAKDTKESVQYESL